MATYKPGDVFVGAVDLFGILVPGAVASGALLASGLVPEGIPVPAPADGLPFWATLFVLSFAIGHVIFAVGGLLDAPLYDHLLKGIFVDADGRAAEARARVIRDVSLGEAADCMNVYQFCSRVLDLRAPAAAASVYRLEADQKFFRSTAVVLVLLVFLLGPPVESTMMLVAASVVCLLRYGSRRAKAVHVCYQFAILLAARADRAA